MTARSFLVLSACATLTGTACAPSSHPAPPPTEISPVIALDSLTHQDPRGQALWTAEREHLLARTKGWSYLPPRKSGGTLYERWCGPGVPADACSTGRVATQPQPGWAYATLSQYFYGDRWPAVFGFALEAGDLPSDGAWGVQLTLSLGGRGIGGDGLGLVFRRARAGQLTDAVRLGDTLSWTAGATRFSVSAPAGADRGATVEAELARFLASPASLRETALARLDALLAEVERGIEAHEAKRELQGPYAGDGKPPPTRLVPLDAVEETKALAEAVAAIGQQRALVEADAEAMHAALLGLIPATLPLGGT